MAPLGPGPISKFFDGSEFHGNPVELDLEKIIMKELFHKCVVMIPESSPSELGVLRSRGGGTSHNFQIFRVFPIKRGDRETMTMENESA